MYRVVENGIERGATDGEMAAIKKRAVEVATCVVPQEVTRRQARQALLLEGLLEKVDLAIAAIEDPMQRGLTRIEWEDSQTYERQRPALISIGQAIGLDHAALDELFIKAGRL